MIREWLQHALSNRQLVVLGLFLLAGAVLIFYLGDILAPVLVSLVLAYLLEPGVTRLKKWHVPRSVAAAVLLLLLLIVLVLLMMWVGSQWPRFVDAMQNLENQTIDVQAIKTWLQDLRANSELLQLLMDKNSLDGVNDEQALNQYIGNITDALKIEPDLVLKNFFSLGGQTVYVLIMVLLVPVMAFFMLKDKQALINWFKTFLPEERALAGSVWAEVDAQIGNYIRGKAVEVIIVGGATTLLFWYFNLDNYVVLGILVGLSVLIPYIGSVVVTIPIFFLAILDPDLGWSSALFWMMAWYLVIQILDGQVLVPVIFSEAMSMHPLAIIISVLFFGGLWGFWGAFFAIPLAVLVNAIIKAWPRKSLVVTPADTDEIVLGDTLQSASASGITGASAKDQPTNNY